MLLKRRAACILPRNQDGADLLIPFFIGDGKETIVGAIIIQVKKCLNANDAKEVGRKLFASYVFKHWDHEENKTFRFSEWFLNLD
jgi:hypothetical protein